MHGTRAVYVYELHPSWTADVNYASSFSRIYEEVLRSMNDFGQFEQVILSSNVQEQPAADVGLFVSSAGGIWQDTGHAPQNGGSRHHPAIATNAFGAGKRALYIALLHSQLCVDIIVDADTHDGTLDLYSVLYLTDMHVDRRTSLALQDWVRRGGILYGTAGAGSRFESNEPNGILSGPSGVFGVGCESLVWSQRGAVGKTLTWIKRDLPYETAMDAVKMTTSSIHSNTGQHSARDGQQQTHDGVEDDLTNINASSSAASQHHRCRSSAWSATAQAVMIARAKGSREGAQQQLWLRLLATAEPPSPAILSAKAWRCTLPSCLA